MIPYNFSEYGYSNLTFDSMLHYDNYTAVYAVLAQYEDLKNLMEMQLFALNIIAFLLTAVLAVELMNWVRSKSLDGGEKK